MGEYSVGAKWPLTTTHNVTASRYNIVAEENHTYFTVSGAENHVTFILPSAVVGLEYTIQNTSLNIDWSLRKIAVETTAGDEFYYEGTPDGSNYVQIWSSGQNNALTFRARDSGGWNSTAYSRAGTSGTWFNLQRTVSATRTVW